MPRATCRPTLHMRRTATLVGLATLSLAACGSDPMQRTEERYCTEVGDHLADLGSPSIASAADIERVLDAWRTVSRSAPIAVQAEWESVVEALEAASTVDPADPESVQAMADQARAAEPAANLIITYTFTKCGAIIGIAPPPP